MGSIGTITTRAGAQVEETYTKTAITVQELIDNTLLFLRDRSTAYKRVFNKTDLASKLVLKDFLTFSHWGETRFVEDARMAERLRGRQDVILRILQHTTLTPKQLMTLLNNSPVPNTDEEHEENGNG